MKNTKIFDVVVVYDSRLATSASNTLKKYKDPFASSAKASHYNNSYGYFLEKCKELGLKAAFATSEDIIGAGEFKSFWVHDNGEWNSIRKHCYAPLIFDKFSNIGKKDMLGRQILFSKKSISSFTNGTLRDLLSDKYKLYEKLPECSVPTVLVENESKSSIEKAFAELDNIISKNHNPDNFLKSFILKNRFGQGGDRIYKIDSDFVGKTSSILKKENRTHFILQPFVKFDNGYSYKENRGFTEIRFLYLGNKIVQNYIRVAKNGQYICNEGEGGIPVNIEDIPEKVQELSSKISTILSKGNDFYALDFIVSNNGDVFLLEANISPGIDWHNKFPENVRMNKKTIDIIVGELARRTQLLMAHPLYN